MTERSREIPIEMWKTYFFSWPAFRTVFSSMGSMVCPRWFWERLGICPDVVFLVGEYVLLLGLWYQATYCFSRLWQTLPIQSRQKERHVMSVVDGYLQDAEGWESSLPSV